MAESLYQCTHCRVIIKVVDESFPKCPNCSFRKYTKVKKFNFMSDILTESDETYNVNWTKCMKCGYINLVKDTTERCQKCDHDKNIVIDDEIWICQVCGNVEISKEQPDCSKCIK